MATRTTRELRPAGARKSGLMAASMRVNGTKTRPTVRDSSGTQTVTSMRAIGRTTKLTATGSISMPTELDIWVSGAMISKMATVWRLGPTVASTRASTSMARNTDKASTSGSMALSTRVNGLITRLVASVHIAGLMAESTRASGLTITCMVKESTRGVMAANMRVSTSMIKSTVRGLMYGRMVALTLEVGRMVNRMDAAFTSSLTVGCEKASGARVREPTGRMSTTNSSSRISNSFNHRRQWAQQQHPSNTAAPTIQDNELRCNTGWEELRRGWMILWVIIRTCLVKEKK